MTRPMTRAALLTALALPVGAGAMPAHANVVAHEAQFSVSLAADHRTTAEITNDQCSGTDAEGNPTVVTLTGRAQQTARFRTTRPATVAVTKRRGGPAEAYTDTRKPLRVTGSYTRTSDVDGGAPHGCNGSPPRETDCGTRTVGHTFGGHMTYRSGQRWNGLAFGLERRGSRLPAFDACRMLQGQVESPFLTTEPIVVKVAESRLVDRRRRTIVVRGRAADPAVANRNAKVSGALSWTLTLKRRATKLTKCDARGSCRYVRLRP
jgi:hypothetical protein